MREYRNQQARHSFSQSRQLARSWKSARACGYLRSWRWRDSVWKPALIVTIDPNDELVLAKRRHRKRRKIRSKADVLVVANR
jgi:hypothetical protein